MEYKEEEFLQISGLQHFQFCRRQWALIHIEQLWAENLRTVEGELLHQRAHGASQRESRGTLLITRDMRVFSASLGISGSCDVVEFTASQTGVPLSGATGRWRNSLLGNDCANVSIMVSVSRILCLSVCWMRHSASSFNIP